MLPKSGRADDRVCTMRLRVPANVKETASISPAGQIVTVTFRGDLDYSVITGLLDTFRQARATPGARLMVVDLAAVRFIDSSALGAFVTEFRFARQDGLRFEVVNASPAVQRSLAMTGIAHMFTATDG